MPPPPRRSSPRRPGAPAGARPAARGGGQKRSKGGDGRSAAGDGRPGDQRGRVRRDPRQPAGERSERRSGPSVRHGEAKRTKRVPPRQVERPMTAAQRRAAEVRETRGERPPRQEVAPPPWERETWQDDGPIRREASKAARRAQTPALAEPITEVAPRRRKTTAIAPEVAADLDRAAPAGRATRYQERLASAADALDRGRYADARRMVNPVLRDLPEVAFAHEIAGLAAYRLGEWRKAAGELELARQLDGSVQHHAVLADCYRALRRYHEVDQLWRELKSASPAPALLAEGRIVAAGALADQRDLAGALQVMAPAASAAKRVREHHLRQWYVIADLHDRAGDVIAARRFFRMVHDVDADFADVATRLRALGR